jgi:hypothetical protein
MENLSVDLATEESQLPFHVIIQQVRAIIISLLIINESQETTKNLIKEIAIEKNITSPSHY